MENTSTTMENAMTNKEKASELLTFMEEEWDAKSVINTLNHLLKDDDLAEVYDRLVAKGIL